MESNEPALDSPRTDGDLSTDAGTPRDALRRRAAAGREAAVDSRERAVDDRERAVSFA